jgi:hypothetical protein
MKNRLSSIVVSLFSMIATVAILMIVQTPVCAEDKLIKLNGGMEAKVNFVGLKTDNNNAKLSISLSLFNNGKNTFYLITNRALPHPSVVDNTGAVYNFDKVSGIASCNGSSCNDLQNFTQIDPGTYITLNFQFYKNGKDTGPVISFTTSLQALISTEQMQDGTVSGAQKLKQLRVINISYPSLAVTE